LSGPALAFVPEKNLSGPANQQFVDFSFYQMKYQVKLIIMVSARYYTDSMNWIILSFLCYFVDFQHYQNLPIKITNLKFLEFRNG
jgi:hypothetical protein